MEFKEFIEKLNSDDKSTFEKYSKIRGVQQYKIIFEALNKVDSNVKFADVNSFVILDKAIKDVLFKYLGTLEEFIRNDILLRFDFDSEAVIKKPEYHYFKGLPKCIRKNNPADEITAFYKMFSLNFGDLVFFIKDYDSQTYDTSKLDMIINLRNSVMHHSPLLFDCNFESTVDETLKGINALVEMLPSDYKDGCIKNLKVPNKKTQDNIASAYYEFLLYKEDWFLCVIM